MAFSLTSTILPGNGRLFSCKNLRSGKNLHSSHKSAARKRGNEILQRGRKKERRCNLRAYMEGWAECTSVHTVGSSSWLDNALVAEDGIILVLKVGPLSEAKWLGSGY